MEKDFKIKYSSEKPPNWIELVKAMPQVSALWAEGLIVTYGDTYYSKEQTTEDLVAHETEHVRQQAQVGGPEVWWQKFLSDPNFKLMQELEAYKVQLAFLRNKHASDERQKRKYMLRQYEDWMAKTLSGEIYGKIITYDKAMQLIKS